MKVSGKAVAMFRTVKDPMIGPKPRQAFVPPDYGWECYMTEGEGLYIKTDKGDEHFIGAGNIESVRFVREGYHATEFGSIRRGPGRPKKEEQSGAV